MPTCCSYLEALCGVCLGACLGGIMEQLHFGIWASERAREDPAELHSLQCNGALLLPAKQAQRERMLQCVRHMIGGTVHEHGQK